MKIVLTGILGGRGGIQKHLYWLTQVLAEANHQVLVLSNNDISSDNLNFKTHFQDQIQIHCFETQDSLELPVPQQWWVKGKLFQKLIKIVDEFAPDIYYSIGTSWKFNLIPLFLKQRIPRIYHEVLSGDSSGRYDSRWLVRWFYDELIGQTPTTTKSFISSFNWQKKSRSMAIFPEPLELTAHIPDAQPKKIPMGTARAAYFSRLNPEKRAFALVKHWHLLEDVLAELHIYGDGPDEQPIRDFIDEQGMGDRVKCFGAYSGGQTYADRLLSYDLTVLPTVGSEGAPIVLLESMACGVPFVAYGAGGIPHYGENNPNVIVVPLERDATKAHQAYLNALNSPHFKDKLEDIKLLANRVEQTLTQEILPFIVSVREMIDRLAKNQVDNLELQKYYQNHYSYESLKKQWLDFFEEYHTENKV